MKRITCEISTWLKTVAVINSHYVIAILLTTLQYSYCLLYYNCVVYYHKAITYYLITILLLLDDSPLQCIWVTKLKE